MKAQWFVGLIIGGIVSFAANIVIGFIFGFGLGIYIDRTHTGPPVADSAMMLAFVFPSVLITTGGPLAGATVGLISSRLKSLRAIVFVTLIVGLAHGSLCFLSTGGTVLYVWADYTFLAVVSALISGLAIYRALSRLRQNHVNQNHINAS